MLLQVTLTPQGQELTVQKLTLIKATENLPFGLRQRVSLTPAPENLKRLSFNIALLVSLCTLSSKVFRMLFLLTSLLFGVWIDGTLGNISLTNQGHSYPLQMQTEVVDRLFCEILDDLNTLFLEVVCISPGYSFSSYCMDKEHYIIVILTVILGVSPPGSFCPNTFLETVSTSRFFF